MSQALKATILLFCITLSGCFEETWSGFYYPDKNNLLIDQHIGDYSSLEDCRQAANLLMKSNPNADYECGLNCDTSKEKPYICEKTER